MSEVVTGSFLEAHFRARLATGWQTASQLPAGFQNNTEKIVQNNTRTLKNNLGCLGSVFVRSMMLYGQFERFQDLVRGPYPMDCEVVL